MALLEGLTLGSLLCGIATNFAQKGIDLSANELVEALNAGGLPHNHHVHRAVRRCFLRASIHQLQEYERSLQSENDYDEGELAYIARKQLQWANFKSRWVSVPLPAGVSQLAVIDAALDDIAQLHVASDKLANLKSHLVRLAVEEICAHTSWDTCPKALEDQMQLERTGWFAGFSAHMAQELKSNAEFKRIQQSLKLRSIDTRIDILSGFQEASHKETTERLAAIHEAVATERLDESLVDRILNDSSQQTDKILEALRGGPFGRRYFASQTSLMVQLRVNKLTEFFAGRDDDINALDSLINARFARRNNGLILLTAPAGFGKSALAAAWCEYAKSQPDLDLAVHFCSAAQFAAETTDPNKVLEHLWAQVAAVYGETPDFSAPEDALTRVLKSSPPNERKLVIWLDGLDEAQGEIRPFLPEARDLAERVCVVISARAAPGTLPRYLSPWLVGDWAETYGKVPIHTLEKLTSRDVAELSDAAFERANLIPPPDLASKIWHASDGGYAIFVRYMVEDALNRASKGQTIDLGAAPLSLKNYANTELARLQAAPGWDQFAHIFELLTIVRGSIDVASLRAVFTDKPRFNRNALPPELARWLSISPETAAEQTVGFAHPKLGMVFRETLEKSGDRGVADAIDTMTERLSVAPTRMCGYALSHLPFHHVEAGAPDLAAKLLRDESFIKTRFDKLGAQLATDLMCRDWECITDFYASQRDIGRPLSDLNHRRLWANFSQLIKSEAKLKINTIWRQLMGDLGLAQSSSPPRLVFANSTLLPSSIIPLQSDEGEINGALEMNDGRLLVWGDNGLRLWSADREKHSELIGHTHLVSGAIETSDGRSLSWGLDGTLRLWSWDGSQSRQLKGHSGWVKGALETKNNRFLSWANDGTLRLWSSDGSVCTVLEGHTSSVIGALETGDGRFLSWSLDGSLRLWSSDGGQSSELKGHSSPIDGALEARSGSFLSWGRDGSLLLWNSNGSPATRVAAGPARTLGALETKDGRFLSWASDGMLRLWSRDGSASTELKGHNEVIEGVLETKNGRIVSWSRNRGFRLWSSDGVESKQLKGHSRDINGALETRDGRILSWSDDGTLRLWHEDGSKSFELGGHTAAVVGALETRDGHFLSWSVDDTLRLWSGDELDYSHAKDHSYQITGVLKTKDGRILSWGDNVLQLWSSDGSQSIALAGHSKRIEGALETRDGRILSWSQDGKLCLWSDEGLPIRELLGHPLWVAGALETDDGRFLSWDHVGKLRLWSDDGSTSTELKGHTAGVVGALETKDGRFLSWGNDERLRLWSSDGSEIAVLKGRTGPVRGAIEVGDGRFLYWGHDAVLRLWKSDGSEHAELRGHSRASLIGGALKTNDGRLLSWSDDTSLRLWSSDGSESIELKGHAAPIEGALEAQSGFLSWSRDGTLRLWNSDGSASAELRGHPGGVYGALETEDGRFLSWGNEGTAKRWTGSGRLECSWASPNGHPIEQVVICGSNRYAALAGYDLLLFQLPD